MTCPGKLPEIELENLRDVVVELKLERPYVHHEDRPPDGAGGFSSVMHTFFIAFCAGE